jgi:sec-independent protein translocase protein TatA
LSQICNEPFLQAKAQIKIGLITHNQNFMLMFGMGSSEMFIILLAMLLLFGGNKIPELMRGVGRGIKEFNNARAHVEEDIKKGMNEAEKK